MRTPQKIATILAATAIALAPLAGVSAAQAAVPLTNVTATSSTTIGTTGTNASAITISATITTGGQTGELRIILPTGWTFVATQPPQGPTCPSWMTVSVANPTNCGALNGPPDVNAIVIGPTFTNGQVITVTFAANSLNVGSSRDFSVRTIDVVTVVDSGTATLAGGASPTPTPSPTPAPDPTSDSSTAATLAKTGLEQGFVAPLAAALALVMLGAGSAVLSRRRRTS